MFRSTMENVVKEDVLQALNEFEVKNDIPIPSLLEEYLHFVASTGDTVFPWTIIKILVRRKIEQVRRVLQLPIHPTARCHPQAIETLTGNPGEVHRNSESLDSMVDF